MHIKLLGENENGFPLDCTVGKVYEIAIEGVFNKDNSYQYMAYLSKVGNWQVVDKNRECVMKQQDNTWKGIMWLIVGTLLTICFFIGFIEYTFYLKRERDYNYQKESCEAFKKQHPEEEVFYGREVGCKVKHSGYWSRL